MKPHAHNDIAVASCLLEQALAVSERAFLRREALQRPVAAVDGLHPRDDLADLRAVRPDVLHGRRPHAARDEGQILDAPPPRLRRLHHEPVPRLSGTHRHLDAVPVVREHSRSPDAVQHHKPLHIPVEQHIRAAPEHQHWQGALRRPLQRRTHLAVGPHLHGKFRTRRHAEGVKPGQVHVGRRFASGDTRLHARQDPVASDLSTGHLQDDLFLGACGVPPLLAGQQIPNQQLLRVLAGHHIGTPPPVGTGAPFDEPLRAFYSVADAGAGQEAELGESGFRHGAKFGSGL